jgi:hypothetical protein
MFVLCVVSPCGFVDRYQRFGGAYCLHLQPWRCEQYVPPKCWYLSATPHGVTTQRASFNTTDTVLYRRRFQFARVLLHSCTVSYLRFEPAESPLARHLVSTAALPAAPGTRPLVLLENVTRHSRWIGCLFNDAISAGKCWLPICRVAL